MASRLDGESSVASVASIAELVELILSFLPAKALFPAGRSVVYGETLQQGLCALDKSWDG